MNFEYEIDIQGFLQGNLSYGAFGMSNFAQPLPPIGSPRCPLTAYHIFLTAPHPSLKKCGDFHLCEHERMTAELSARLWRRSCGPVCLLTDRRGEVYFRKTGLDQAYDRVIPVLEDCDYDIDLDRYWAAGKIMALLRIKAPCVIIDLDMLVWRMPDLSGCDLAAVHMEPLLDWLYPPLSTFVMSPRYAFPACWDQTAEPLNTAFVYFTDDRFKNEYARQSIRFMQYERDTLDDGSRCMIMAEQRILGMCAAAAGVRVKTFLKYEQLSEPQDLMTHIWSAKRMLDHIPEAEAAYCALCREKLRELSG